jgi:hypothetical protein
MRPLAAGACHHAPPDYQYTPADYGDGELVAYDVYDVVLGCASSEARAHGRQPVYKYISNRLLGV